MGNPGPAGLPLVLAPTPGFNLTYGPNPGMLAGTCIKIQGFVLSGSAFNGSFATTDCHTFELQ